MTRSFVLPPGTVGLCVLALFALVSPARAVDRSDDPAITVLVDNARVMRLPERTQTVIVGNPNIADVSAQRSGVVVLTGKSFGQTNLIALDANGAMLAETVISVQAPRQTSTVMVQRGMERESYSCTPNCQPTMQLGDATRYFTDVSGQADTHRNLAVGAASAGVR